MRTLVISDLHLGSRARHDVLRAPEPRARLLEALDGVDRLVLLGDLVELMTRNRQRSLAVAEPVMREIGQRLGGDREVIVVPGNHDAPLARAWALAQGRRLQPVTAVDGHASRALDRLLGWLAPARTRVSYPGVWLGDRVWATHGQYLDRHLRPHSTIGLQYGRLRSVPRGGALPADYERPRRRPGGRARESPRMQRFMNGPVGALVEQGIELLRVASMPRVAQLMMRGGLAPVTAAVLDAQMRHAAIPAMARVVRRLDVDADWVVFGHVHRRGPLDADRWPHDGTTRFANTGSWLYEPLLVDRARPPHPYWPGGAILLQDGRDPQSIGLLDDLPRDALLTPQQTRPRARR